MVTFTTKESPTFFVGDVKLKLLDPSTALTRATVPAAVPVAILWIESGTSNIAANIRTDTNSFIFVFKVSLLL
jgi:hypothetical protein